MRLSAKIFLGALMALSGCSSLSNRQRERQSAYESFPASVKALVDQGRIDQGMDTNAVYIAWGKPSAVIDGSVAGSSESIWVYSGNRVVHVPSWSYLPDHRGYWTLQPTTLHYPRADIKAEVRFQDGIVADWKKY